MNEQHKPQDEGKDRKLHDPISDKLVPLEPLDLGEDQDGRRSGPRHGQHRIHRPPGGEGAEVLEAMARDRECFVVMTLAGAMTVAKQGLIVTDLIDAGVVKAVISTGALMAHGLVEAAGGHIFAMTQDGRQRTLRSRLQPRV